MELITICQKNNIFVCLFHNHLMFNEILRDDVFLMWSVCKRSFYLTFH